MRPFGTRSLGMLFLSAMALADVATAEVYKWVDAQGNIHFGDKPRDAALAEQAESVEIIESYQPTLRTADEDDAFLREQEALRRRTELYKKEDEEKRKAETARRNEEKAALCADYKEDISKLTTMETVNGVRTYYYLKDEDGKSMTSQRQREMVKELKAKYAALGCER